MSQLRFKFKWSEPQKHTEYGDDIVFLFGRLHLAHGQVSPRSFIPRLYLVMCSTSMMFSARRPTCCCNCDCSIPEIKGQRSALNRIKNKQL